MLNYILYSVIALHQIVCNRAERLSLTGLRLELSPTKCSVLHVCPAWKRNENNSFVYHIGNAALPSVDSVTDLGVT